MSRALSPLSPQAGVLFYVVRKGVAYPQDLHSSGVIDGTVWGHLQGIDQAQAEAHRENWQGSFAPVRA